jgi:hypothetical protein
MAHGLGGWVGSTACLDVIEKKHLLLLAEIEPRLLSCPAPSPVTILSELYHI